MTESLRVLGKGLRRDAPEKLAAKKPAILHPAIALRLMAGRGTVNGRALTGLSGKADLSSFCPPVFDQGATSSCTAHSASGAIYTALQAAKTPLPFLPSPREIYAATRAIERAAANPKSLPPLTDSGAEMADVATALAKYGVCAMGETVDGRESDVGAANINSDPDVMALAAAGKNLLAGEYVIDPTAANASALAAAALEAGLPLWAGFFCDSAFEVIQPGQIAGAPNESDPNGGGHAVYLTGYTTTAIGRVFTLRNSWSAGWCNAGSCLVSEAWLADVWALYPMAVALAPAKEAA